MSDGVFKSFYNKRVWKDLANAIRKERFYLCDVCGCPDSKEVHHIQPLTEQNITDPNISLNRSNLVLLCRDCHNYVHSRWQPTEANQYIFDSCGRITDVVRHEERYDRKQLLLLKQLKEKVNKI